jgi:hypothetical protein
LGHGILFPPSTPLEYFDGVVNPLSVDD